MTGVLVVVGVLLSILLWRSWIHICDLHIALCDCQDELLRRMRDESNSDL